VIFATANTYTGQTDIQGGTIILNAAQNIGPVVVRETAHLMMNTSQHFQGLGLIDGKAKLSAGGDKFVRVDSFDVSGTGQLDLTDGDLIINDKNLTTPEMVRNFLEAGRHGGLWNGPGIMSSTVASNPLLYSIGYADNADLARSSFHGEALDAQAIIVQFTYAGDANLDGMVDIRDIFLFAQHFNQTDTFWYDGDFNFDGVTNSSDLSILAYNWQRGTGSPLLGESFAEIATAFGLPQDAIPEPTSIGLTSMILLAAVGRSRLRTRRRRI
jgi:autotransporter-associated beta strand protein